MSSESLHAPAHGLQFHSLINVESAIDYLTSKRAPVLVQPECLSCTLRSSRLMCVQPLLTGSPRHCWRWCGPSSTAISSRTSTLTVPSHSHIRAISHWRAGKTSRAGLLLWCQDVLASYDDVHIEDLHARSGRSLAAVTHPHRPAALPTGWPTPPSYTPISQMWLTCRASPKTTCVAICGQPATPCTSWGCRRTWSQVHCLASHVHDSVCDVLADAPVTEESSVVAILATFFHAFEVGMPLLWSVFSFVVCALQLPRRRHTPQGVAKDDGECLLYSTDPLCGSYTVQMMCSTRRSATSSRCCSRPTGHASALLRSTTLT